MTTEDMIIAVNLKLSNSIKNTNINKERILYFLNISQEELLTDYLKVNKTSNLYEYFDAEYELFSPLIKEEKISIVDYSFALPNNHYLTLNFSNLIDKKGNKISIKLLKLNNHSSISDLPYYKDNSLFINVIQFSKQIKLLENNDNVAKIDLFYIRKPVIISDTTNCELNLMYHLQVVEKAIVNIYKSYEDIQGLQINNN